MSKGNLLKGLVLGVPANQPFGCIFEGDESAHDGPVHCPSLKFRLTERAMGKGLESCIAGEEECEPGAEQQTS